MERVKRACRPKIAQAEARLRAQGSGGTRTEQGGELLVDISWFQEFRKEMELCAGPEASAKVIEQMLSTVALPSGLAYRLQYGDYARTGWIDLDPQFRLRTLTPVNGGYETAWYNLTARKGGGVFLSLASVEERSRDGSALKERPAADLLSLPDSTRYLRMYFRSWTIAGDRKIALLGARTPDELGASSGAFERDPAGFCAVERAGVCITVPREVALSAEMRIVANGKEVMVPVGGTVRDALRESGVKDASGVLKTLQVLRPYRGDMVAVEFDRTKSTILGLVFLGGESLAWKAN